MLDLKLKGLCVGDPWQSKKGGWLRKVVVTGKKGAKVFTVYAKTKQGLGTPDATGNIELAVDIQDFCFSAEDSAPSQDV